MGLVSLLQKQAQRRAEMICKHRNQSLPAEFGKASYEMAGQGVVFIKQFFLLDSNHCEYMSPVAKVDWNDDLGAWQLFMLSPEESDQESWTPYPYLPPSLDLTAIMREVDKDPKAVFWD
ncbi:DUF3024 domain-containing protein [Vibrio scophthalmi]|uniref:DUF3024 domain-containing protein n=1 Tax=Vibrio scophthalmi TaxID=45658 RepID=UPI002FF058C7